MNTRSEPQITIHNTAHERMKLHPVDQRLDWRCKGLPPAAEGLRMEELRGLGLSLLAGDLMLPVAVLRESCLRNNRKWMRNFLRSTGVKLCPHGKTTMSPEIFRMQEEDGVWGFTAATAHHVRIYRHLGIRRVLLANQLIGKANIDYVLGELVADAHFDFYCLVDSLESVRVLGCAVAASGLVRPLQVLVEVGANGGRTGVRSLAQGLEVAQAAAANTHLSLRGIEAFEGIFQTSPDAVDLASGMLESVVDLALRSAERGLFAAGPILLSAGGSGLFDLCSMALCRPELRDRVDIVLRSGCYVTHDSGLYERLFERLLERLRDRIVDVASLGPGLQAALEVWACVHSTPEPGRLVAGFGKRDISYDADPPRLLWWYRAGLHETPQVAPPGFTVSHLYDQHACLDGPQGIFAVGDYLGFGVSHPCTTFDKWRTIPVVDDSYRVTSAVTTMF